MSVLKTLKLSAATPAASANEPLSRAREKLLGQLTEQKNMVSATLEGRLYEPPKVAAICKNAAGERVRVEVARRARKGWFQDQAGTCTLSCGSAASRWSCSRARLRSASAASTRYRPHRCADHGSPRGELDPQIKEAAAARGLMMAERRKKAA